MSRLFPRPSPYRIFPLPSPYRDIIDLVDPLRVFPGKYKRCLLGDRCYPFGEAAVITGNAITTVEYMKTGDVAYTTVAAGTYPDALTAAKYVSFAPTVFSAGVTFTLKITDSSGNIRTKEVLVVSDVQVARDKIAATNQRIRPFCDATFATDATKLASAAYQEMGGAKTPITASGGDTLIEAIQKLELSWGSSGTKTLTLFVTDTGAVEFSDTIIVMVR